MMRMMILAMCMGAGTTVADQTGAEATKTPVAAKVVGARTIANYAGTPVGNVQVIYKDGSKDQWTLKGNASSPKVSTRGTVGWVLSPLDEDGKTLALYKKQPTFPRLRLVQGGKVLATVEAERPFIEEWGFSKDGVHVILKSRGLHGPAFLQRFAVRDGAPKGRTPAFGDDLPAWAQPFEE